MSLVVVKPWFHLRYHVFIFLKKFVRKSVSHNVHDFLLYLSVFDPTHKIYACKYAHRKLINSLAMAFRLTATTKRCVFKWQSHICFGPSSDRPSSKRMYNCEYVTWLCFSSEIISWMQFGNFPLHAAAFGNHVKVVQYLLEKKADLTLLNKVGDIFACSRIRCAWLLAILVVRGQGKNNLFGFAVRLQWSLSHVWSWNQFSKGRTGEAHRHVWIVEVATCCKHTPSNIFANANVNSEWIICCFLAFTVWQDSS